MQGHSLFLHAFMQYRIKGDGRKRVFPAFDPGQTEQPFHQTGNPGILFFNCIQEGAVIQAVLYAGGVHGIIQSRITRST